MSIMSLWPDLLNSFVMAAIWLQPVVWMMVFYVKSTKHDETIKLFSISMLVSLASVYLMPINWSPDYAFIPLFAIYGSLALTFALILMWLDWHAPQALSAGFLTAFVGSYFWEVPYIIRNALITGPQGDWFLHALGLFYVYFMAGTVGWQISWRSALLIIGGLAISTVFMLNWQVAPVSSASASQPDIWNNGYWMLNRIIGACIMFAIIRKSPPVVKDFGK